MFVQAIMEKIVAVASIGVIRADEDRMSQRRRCVRAPGHFLVRLDVHKHRKYNVPRPIGGYPIWRSFRREEIVVIGHIKLHCQRPLLQIVSTDDRLRASFRLGNRRQQQAGKDRHNCDHYQQLDQRKTPKRRSSPNHARIIIKPIMSSKLNHRTMPS